MYKNRTQSQEVLLWLKRQGMQPVESVKTKEEAMEAALEKIGRIPKEMKHRK
jgi:hypothetical protein